MLIQDIMITPVISVSPSTALDKVIRIMDDKRIGFMVVEKKRKAVGVITEGNIVALAAKADETSQYKAKDVMSSPVFTVPADANAFYAYDELISRHMRHLVVVDVAGDLAGVVTMSCFIANLGVEHFTDLQCVYEIISEVKATVTPDTPLKEAIRLLHEHRHAMVAIEDEKAAGILTSRSVTRIYREQLDIEKLTMADVMRPVVSIQRKAFVPEASILMKAHRTRHLVVEGDGGKFVGLLTISDVAYSMEGKYVEFMRTVMRDMEQDLLNKAGQNRALFERNPNAVFSLDLEGNIQDVNPATILLMGANRDSFLGQSICRYFDEHLKDEGKQALKAATRGHAESLHLRLKTADGNFVHVFMTFVPIQSQGRLDGVYAVTYDITERVLAEQRLLKISEALLQTSEAIAITDERGYIEFANPALDKLLLHETGQCLGKKLHDLLRDERQQPVYDDSVWEQVSEGIPYKGEIQVCLEEGQNLILKVSCSPVHIPGAEHVVYYINIFEDMTESRRRAERIEQAQKMETIGTLAGGVAHEFNNYLAAVQGTLHLLRNEVGHLPKVTRKITALKERTEREAVLVSSLLTYARQDYVQHRLLNLSMLLRDMKGLVHMLIPDSIDMHWDVSDDLFVEGAASQLQQVLLNLLSNAQDALEETENPSIEVALFEVTPDTTWRQQHADMQADVYVCLKVSDNGRGISEADCARIFDPFFTSKAIHEGTGLGLSMVAGAVQGHQGCIEVQSKVGEGASFLVYLPKQQADTSLSCEQDEGCILFADDDADVREVGAEIIASLGYPVVVAKDGQDALDIFQENPSRFVMAILDVMMPKMSGCESAMVMRQTKKDFPVLFLTGFGRNVVPDELLQEKYTTMLKKPWNLDDLEAVIREFCQGSGQAK